MRRGVLWTGMILILATVVLAAPAPQRPTFEPLRAKIVVEHTDANQQPATETGQFYRDAEGRTRVEIGSHIIITDPVARTRYDIDTAQHVAHKMALPPGGRRGPGPGGDAFMPPPPPPPPPAGATGPPANGLMPPPPPPRPDGPPPERKDLGTRQIEGLTAQGWEVTRLLPPRPDATGSNVTETTQTWVSEELKLPLVMESVVSDGHKHSRRFTEIQRHAVLDASLFGVPAGYEVVNAPLPPPPRRP